MTDRRTWSDKQLFKRISGIIISLCLISALLLMPFTSFAAASNNYKVISPIISKQTGIAYYDNVLISVRVEPERTLRITLYNYPDYTDASSIAMVPAAAFIEKKQVGASYYYSAHPKLSFFTKRVKLRQGLYAIRIETLNENGRTIETTDTFFIAKPSSAKEPVTINKTTPSGRVIFFQRVFKNIFGSTVNENE